MNHELCSRRLWRCVMWAIRGLHRDIFWAMAKKRAITVKGLRVYHALLKGHSKAISMITTDVSLSLIPLAGL